MKHWRAGLVGAVMALGIAGCGDGVSGRSEHYDYRMLYFREHPAAAGSRLFIGDSHTEKMFSAVAAVTAYDPLYQSDTRFRSVFYDAGISGDDSAGVLERIDYHLSTNPSQVVILIGTNDYLSKQYLANMRKIVAKVRNAGVSLSIVSILPRPPVETGGNERVDGMNASLAELCAEQGIPFVDINSLFRGDEEAFADSVHLKAHYYDELAATLVSQL